MKCPYNTHLYYSIYYYTVTFFQKRGTKGKKEQFLFTIYSSRCKMYNSNNFTITTTIYCPMKCPFYTHLCPIMKCPFYTHLFIQLLFTIVLKRVIYITCCTTVFVNRFTYAKVNIKDQTNDLKKIDKNIILQKNMYGWAFHSQYSRSKNNHAGAYSLV